MIAKRRGDIWYIGAMTNSNQRILKVKADFLSKGDYILTAWNDVSGFPEKLNKTRRSISTQSLITISMDAGGGFVGVITKNN